VDPLPYSADDILVYPVPPREALPEGRCRRVFRYRFAKAIPRQQELATRGEMLGQRSLVPGREFWFEVSLIKRGECELDVSVTTAEPEQDVVWLLAVRSLPKDLERMLGRVESIEGHPRDDWPAFRWA
jgi:hypothetical protein